MARPGHVRGLASLVRKLEALSPAQQAAARVELKRSLLNIQNGARQRVKVDRGDLRNRIAHETTPDGLLGRAGTNVEHGPNVEFGRRPGSKMPPVAEIRDWAKRKGIKDYDSAAFAIARAIGRRGIAPAPYLLPSFEEERPQFLARLTRALNAAHRDVARGGGGA